MIAPSQAISKGPAGFTSSQVSSLLSTPLVQIRAEDFGWRQCNPKMPGATLSELGD